MTVLAFPQESLIPLTQWIVSVFHVLDQISLLCVYVTSKSDANTEDTQPAVTECVRKALGTAPEILVVQVLHLP